MGASHDNSVYTAVTRYNRLKCGIVALVYHGKEAWQIPLRFARHLTGMEDLDSPLSQVMGRYVADFEPHFVNISAMTDEAIRGEVMTQLLLTVLKYIFSERLGGHLDEMLAMANEVLRQPSGMETALNECHD